MGLFFGFLVSDSLTKWWKLFVLSSSRDRETERQRSSSGTGSFGQTVSSLNINILPLDFIFQLRRLEIALGHQEESPEEEEGEEEESPFTAEY